MTTDISVGVRWDPINQQNETINQDDYEFEYDGGNSSSRLFERSRIKALAGMTNITNIINGANTVIHPLRNVMAIGAYLTRAPLEI